MMPGMYPKIVSRRHIQNSICKTNKQASKQGREQLGFFSAMPSCLGVHPLMSSEVCLSPKTCVPPYFHLAASCWKWCRNRQTLPWKFLSLLSRLSSYYYNWDTSIKKDRVLTMQPYLRNTPRGGKRMAIRISQHVARTPPFPILQKFEKYLLWKKVVAENIPGKKNLKSHNIIIIININKNNKKGSSQ
jgi:hypothetical protein